MFETLRDWLINQGLDASLAMLTVRLGAGVLALIVAWLSWLLARRVVRRGIARLVEHSRANWDDIIIKHGVLDHLLRLVPAVVLQLLILVPLEGLPEVASLARTAIQIYMLVVAILVIDSLLNASLDIYRQYPVSQRFALKSFIQIAKIVLYFVIGVLILAMLLDRSPLAFFSGLGAMTAIILLIFKDSILGFVAGIQLTANNMVRRGDWIQMPKYGADGNVIEIALTTVKVQNWDKTITTVPTYALISDAFKNWRGMTESGGRRIKRSIAIDMTSVRICDQATIDRFGKFAYIADYIDTKQKELADWNEKHNVGDDELINGRRMTNLGTFRAYVEAYLRQHAQVNPEMTFLVRQLQPTEKGLPIEIYVFLREQRWAPYEAIQADIFDHIIAVVPEFGLRVFQQPTGQDVTEVLQHAGIASPHLRSN